jgi:ADP-ribose pyrophosphatase YjhB (NUDIX family)
MKQSRSIRPLEYEFSAGGLVIQGGKILLIQAENLGGEIVWAFPKGHGRKGESAQQTALREVQEETGYLCRIMRELNQTAYFFRDRARLIRKTVRWFLMEPLEQIGAHDDEVRQIAWVPLEEAAARLSYLSDQELLRAATEDLRNLQDFGSLNHAKETP